MNRILIIIFLAISTAVNAQNMCKTTGNVEATFDCTQGKELKLENANKYMVSVDWIVYGIKNGKKIYISESTAIVGSNDSKYIKVGVNCDDYDNFAVKIRPKKCQSE